MSSINRESSKAGSFHVVSTGGLDPTLTPLDAPAGTIGIRLGALPAIYQKQDKGLSTNWAPIALAGTTPISLPGLTSWYDASTILTDGSIVGGGNDLEVWHDKSPSGLFNASQPVIASRPIFTPGSLNGLPTVRFNGAEELDILNAPALYNALKGNYNLYVVSLQDSPNGEYIHFIDGAGSDDFEHEYRGSNNMRMRGGGGSPYTAGFNSFERPSGVFNVFRFRRSGAALSIEVINTGTIDTGGSASTPVGAGTSGNIGSSGGSNFLNGNIAELLIYNRNLSVAEEGLLFAYLSSKWGLP